jgi:uracil-DNA glycosylase
MREPRLVNLNFRELLDYGGQPPVQNRYATPISCSAYCVSCEEDGVLAKAGVQLDLMSHGCDSEDFRSVLGPMALEDPAVDAAILFVLEGPGGDWESGEKVVLRGHDKQPPNYHYYWTPHCEMWPTSLAEFGNNFYGPYFAYLMYKHGLQNVYITNAVKCRWVANPKDVRSDKSSIINHCTQRFLAREVAIVAPRLALCFGNDAWSYARNVLQQVAVRCRVKKLLHPSYIRHRCQTLGRTQQDCIDINDCRVHEALQGIV